MGAQGVVVHRAAVAASAFGTWQWINSAKPPPTAIRCGNCPRLAREIRALWAGLLLAVVVAGGLGLWVAILTVPRQLASH